MTLPPVADAPVQILTLRAGLARADLRPDLGGGLAGLWLGPVAALRSAEPDGMSRARHAACLATVPYAHRLGFRRLDWAGQTHTLAAPVPDAVHVAHGMGWLRPWDVVAVDGRGATFRYRHDPDPSWPFAFEALQTIELTESALKFHLRVTNTHHADQPLGLGWRPVFGKRPHARVHLEARERWLFDETSRLPIAREATHGLDAELRWLHGDHAFEQVHGGVKVRDEKLSLKLTSSLSRVVVTAHESRQHWAMQWLSHAPNALQMVQPEAHGVARVAPNAWIEAWMKIDMAPA